MSTSWYRFLALLALELCMTSAWPAQKFSPGIPISPTVNQNPGQVSGVITESTKGSAVVSQQTYTPPVAPSPAPVVYQSQPAPAPVVYQSQPAPAPVMYQSQPAPAPVVYQSQPAPQRMVYLQGNSPVYSSPQYTSQTPTAYVYPDGSYAQPPPAQTSTRFGNTYYSPPSTYYPSSPSNYYSGSPSNYYSSSNSPSFSSTLSDSLGFGNSRPSYSGTQTLGALGALGALGTLGAGALLFG